MTMNILLHRDFEKSYIRLRRSEKERFKMRKKMFIENPFNPILENHPLKGEMDGCHSFHIGGDLSVIYHFVQKDTVRFLNVGTHHQLFGL